VKKIFILLGAVLVAMSGVRADVEIAFAVPDDGCVTLGVFDGAGRLVRTLHKLSRQEDFRIGLNGLITTWDGKDDDGNPLPAGNYHVRGYLVDGDVKVSGEDFLFNDFAADAGFPGFLRILDFSLLENGDIVLLAESQPAPLLARISEERGFLWSVKTGGCQTGFARIPSAPRTRDAAGHPLGGSVIAMFPSPTPPTFGPMLATNGNSACVVSMSAVEIHSLDDGGTVLSVPSGGGKTPLAAAANDVSLLISSVGGLTGVSLPSLDQETVTPTPSAFTSIDVDVARLVGSSPEGVWIRKEAFAKVEIPAAVGSVALGTPDTFWFVGSVGDSSFVGQAAFGGEILRTLRPAPEDPRPEKIRASRTEEKFAVLESLPGLQRLRVMARAEGGEWTIGWERTIRDFSWFGFVDGKPAADAGDATQPREVRFHLKENPLTGQKDFLTIRAVIDKSGSRLVSPDGLPLVEVSNRDDVIRTVIHRGDSSGSLRLLQGNGFFVEEFSITGLDDILPLDAGDVELP
jgi:hypothetical protein